MTSGYPTAATDNAVQANIITTSYATSTGSGSSATGPIVASINSAKCIANNNAAATGGNKVRATVTATRQRRTGR